MIFESHAHYDDKRFDDDRDRLLSSMPDHNIGTIINVGSNLDGLRQSVELSEKYNFVYAAVGIHPSDIDDLNEDVMAEMEAFAKSPKVVAIGEIGLDYYWEKDKDRRKTQKSWFERQLELARKVELPVIIHSRDAAKDTFDVLKIAAGMGTKAVVHCYSGSPEMAEDYVKLGFYLGVGGVVTFDNAKNLKETVERIPLGNILVETDSPYLTPSPFRGKRNDSTYLPYVIKEIAKIKNVTEDEVIEVTEKNGKKLFTKIK